MPLFSLSLGILLLALAVAATPVVPHGSLIASPKIHRGPWRTHSAYNFLPNNKATAQNLTTRDSSASMKTADARRTFNVATHDNKGAIQCAPVGFGIPPKIYSLIVDTGSSNTWYYGTPSQTAVLQNEATNTSKAFVDRANVVEGVYIESYGSGDAIGIEYYADTITIGDMVLHNQSVGVVELQRGISDTGCDGILGIGPTDLTADTTLGPSGGSAFATVTDTAYGQGLLDGWGVGVSYLPTPNSAVGELNFGGADTSKFVGDLKCVSVTSTPAASHYWGINATSTYGNERTTVMPLTSGILDTGTTLVLLASDFFEEYKSVTGAVLDDQTGLLQLTKAQFAQLETFYIRAGDVNLELTPDAQTMDPNVVGNSGSPDNVYLIFGDLGQKSGSGLDFIFGYVLHQRYYTYYDSGNQRICLARTSYTDQNVNYPR